MSVASVLSAIQALSDRIAALGGGSGGTGGFQSSPIGGTISLVGGHPVVTATDILAPADLIRVSLTITVRENGVNRVYIREEVAAVGSDGRTITLSRLPSTQTAVITAENSNSQYVLSNGLGVKITSPDGHAFPLSTLTFVSATLQMLVRYHYV